MGQRPIGLSRHWGRCVASVRNNQTTSNAYPRRVPPVSPALEKMGTSRRRNFTKPTSILANPDVLIISDLKSRLSPAKGRGAELDDMQPEPAGFQCPGLPLTTNLTTTVVNAESPVPPVTPANVTNSCL